MKKLTSYLLPIAASVFLFSVSCQAEINWDVSKDAAGYKISGKVKKTSTGLEFPLEFNTGKGGVDIYGKTIEDLIVNVDYESADRLHVKIADKDQKQVIVPDSPLGFERPNVQQAAKHRNYNFKYTNNPFGFQVIRSSDNEVIFDTTNYPLVFEDQYLELTTAVPDDANIYGFGETTRPHFRHNNEKNITTIYARDAADPFYGNAYGTHPVYTEIRNGKAHGALLMNAHGMDILTVEGRITWKVIGGILDFYFFVPKEATPNAVLQSYTDLVGKPMMPAQWMLGFHQCRWGYDTIDNIYEVVKGYKDAEIPLETVWADIDYMNLYKAFTFDPVNFPEDRMKELSKELHDNKQKMVLMLDPGMAYQDNYTSYIDGTELDVWLKNPDGTHYIGQVWPGYTVYPDWFHPNMSEYWNKEVVSFMKTLNLDGIWIDMNEPASFCYGSCGTGKMNVMPPSLEPWTLPQEQQGKINAEHVAAMYEMAKFVNDSRNLLNPPYMINNYQGNLSEHAVSTIAYHYGDIAHYDVHSLYGHGMAYHTKNALAKYQPGERPFILSRSTFAGTGKRAFHWLGDNTSLWSYLQASITGVFDFSMFGIPYVGADICGFNGNTTEQLCTRWQELGAFYPFSRNHNVQGGIPQEAFRWNSTAEASRKALNIRYSLLPYYYTLFEEAGRLGTGVWRPLIFEYPTVDAFLDNSNQALIGTDLLLSPVVTENATSVEAQFPEGIWYDWYTRDVVKGTTEAITLDAPLTHIPIHIRGGAVIPTKSPKLTVQDTYATPYSLIVALDERGRAAGRLYIDDGHSLEQAETSDITFTYKKGVLMAKGNFGYSKAEKLESITIIGAKKLSKATYRGQQYKLSSDNNAYVVDGLGIDLSRGPFTVKFQ